MSVIPYMLDLNRRFFDDDINGKGHRLIDGRVEGRLMNVMSLV